MKPVSPIFWVKCWPIGRAFTIMPVKCDCLGDNRIRVTAKAGDSDSDLFCFTVLMKKD
jgi:hypothetical protein